MTNDELDAAFLNKLADAEREIGQRFQADLKQGTMHIPSPEWTKWERAQDAFARSMAFRKMAASLVREGIEPPAAVDQDTLDTRAVLGAWLISPEAAEVLSESDIAEVKLVVREIKDRVRREERE